MFRLPAPLVIIQLPEQQPVVNHRRLAAQWYYLTASLLQYLFLPTELSPTRHRLSYEPDSDLYDLLGNYSETPRRTLNSPHSRRYHDSPATGLCSSSKTVLRRSITRHLRVISRNSHPEIPHPSRQSPTPSAARSLIGSQSAHSTGSKSPLTLGDQQLGCV